jgi:G3E family GTPase
VADKTLPVVILGGYLGVGKTTLLNRLLREQHGLRLAVLVNDFGGVNVDAALVESSDGETIALTNGCICCGMADGFIQVLYRLREQADRLDGVVVETSGVADPAMTAAYATLPGFRPAAVIVLADAERVQKQGRDSLIGKSIHRQLKAADVVVVTKGDLAGTENTAAVVAWIKSTLPEARVIASPAGQAPISLLFDAIAAESEHDMQVQHSRQMPDPAHGSGSHGSGSHGSGSHGSGSHGSEGEQGYEHEHENHDTLYERAMAAPQRALSERELRQWYAALPDDVLRVKGWVQLHDGSGTVAPALVQGVGRRLEITPTKQGAFPQDALLVLLGLAGSLAAIAAPDGTPLVKAM